MPRLYDRRQSRGCKSSDDEEEQEDDGGDKFGMIQIKIWRKKTN